MSANITFYLHVRCKCLMKIYNHEAILSKSQIVNFLSNAKYDMRKDMIGTDIYTGPIDDADRFFKNKRLSLNQVYINEATTFMESRLRLNLLQIFCARQRRIYDSVKHLRQSFSEKTVDGAFLKKQLPHVRPMFPVI